MQTASHRVARVTLPRCLLGLFFLLGNAGCSAQPLTAPALPQPSLVPETLQPSATMTTSSTEFNLIPDRDDAHLTAEVVGEVATIQVVSQSGIGGASVEILSPTLPKRILIQFQLPSLERLRFTYNQTMVEVSLPKEEGIDPSESVTREGNPAMSELLTPGDPEWINVRLVATQPSLPLEEDYIEIEVPPAFWQDGGRQFSIQWINFFR